MSRKPRKVGRPKMAKAQRRARSITFRARDGLANQLRRFADAGGISVSDEIVARLDGGTDEATALLRDLARVLRIGREWNASPLPAATDDRAAKKWTSGEMWTNGEIVQAALHIVVDAHIAGRVPPDLLENKRHGPTRGRMLAHMILANPFAVPGDKSVR